MHLPRLEFRASNQVLDTKTQSLKMVTLKCFDLSKIPKEKKRAPSSVLAPSKKGAFAPNIGGFLFLLASCYY